MRLLVALLVHALLAREVRAQTPSARIIGLRGDVQVAHGNADWTDARVDLELVKGDAVQTGPDSEATLAFGTGATLALREMTEISVGQLLTPAGRAQAVVLMKLGEVTAKVKPQQAVRSDLSIRTPTATASVRGTEFKRVSFHPARGTEVELLSGRVTVESARDRIDTLAGEPSTTPADGRIQGPRQLTSESARVHVEPVGLTAPEREQIHVTNQPQAAPAARSPVASGEVGSPGGTLVLRYVLQ